MFINYNQELCPTNTADNMIGERKERNKHNSTGQNAAFALLPNPKLFEGRELYSTKYIHAEVTGLPCYVALVLYIYLRGTKITILVQLNIEFLFGIF